jgi:Family of unknown function (DUF5335)
MARTQEISKQEWPDFFKLFSQRHNQWLISLEDGVVSVLHQPLKEIRMENGQIVVKAGDHNVVISKPVEISLKSTDEGADEAIEIKTESGKTLLLIDSPKLPEMVDGIP